MYAGGEQIPPGPPRRRPYYRRSFYAAPSRRPYGRGGAPPMNQVK